MRLSHLLQLSQAAALLVNVATDEDADKAVAAVAETGTAAMRPLHPVFALPLRAIPKR